MTWQQHSSVNRLPNASLIWLAGGPGAGGTFSDTAPPSPWVRDSAPHWIDILLNFKNMSFILVKHLPCFLPVFQSVQLLLVQPVKSSRLYMLFSTYLVMTVVVALCCCWITAAHQPRRRAYKPRCCCSRSTSRTWCRGLFVTYRLRQTPISWGRTKWPRQRLRRVLGSWTMAQKSTTAELNNYSLSLQRYGWLWRCRSAHCRIPDRIAA